MPGLSSAEKATAIQRTLIALEEQIDGMISKANNPSGWKKAFDDKSDFWGKDIVKHTIAAHSRKSENRKF